MAVTNALCVDADDLSFAHMERGRSLAGAQYCADTETAELLDEFERLGLRATFFVPGSMVREAPDTVRRIAAAGHEIGSHGTRHTVVEELGRDGFVEDVRASKRNLEDLTGAAVDCYRAPFWSITRRCLWAYDTLVEEGFRIDHSAMPHLVDALDKPHGTVEPFLYGESLLVIPVTSLRLPGYTLPLPGGFYNAHLPFRWQARFFDGLNGRGLPFSFYFHPFEHSPQAPNRRLVKYGSPFLSVYALHVGCYRTLLPKLADRYRLAPVSDAYGRWCSLVTRKSPRNSASSPVE